MFSLVKFILSFYYIGSANSAQKSLLDLRVVAMANLIDIYFPSMVHITYLSHNLVQTLTQAKLRETPHSDKTQSAQKNFPFPPLLTTVQ